MAHGVYYRTSRGVPESEVPWLIVVSILTFNPHRIESPLPMHFLCLIYHYPLLLIVVSFVWVSSNVKSRPISPTQKWRKSWLVDQKRMPFPHAGWLLYYVFSFMKCLRSWGVTLRTHQNRYVRICHKIVKLTLEGPNLCHPTLIMAWFTTHIHPKAACKRSIDRSIGKWINRMVTGQKSHIFTHPQTAPDMKIGPPGSN